MGFKEASAVVARSSRDKETAKRIVLAYLILWIIEGALRKWAFPPLQHPLYFIRVPIVAWAVLFTVSRLRRPAPAGAAVGVVIVAVVGTFTCAHILLGHQSLFQGVLGVRLWLELILMPLAMIPWLTPEIARACSRAIALLGIPIAAIALTQVTSPPHSWINKLLADDGSDNFTNPGGAVRATGTFSSSLGHSLYVEILLASTLSLIINTSSTRGDRRLGIILSPAVLLLMFTSGSRTVIFGALATLILVSPLVLRRRPLQLFGSALVITIVAFLMWQAADMLAPSATQGLATRFSGNGAVVEPTGRVTDSLTDWWAMVPHAEPFGLGLGSTSQGLRSSGIAAQTESEWGQWMIQLGPLLFLVAVFLRISTLAVLARNTWTLAGLGNLSGAVFLSTGFVTILSGPITNQGSANGFAVVVLLISIGHTSSPEARQEY